MGDFLFLRPGLLTLFIPLAFLVWMLLRKQDDEAQLRRLVDPSLLKHLIIRPEEEGYRIKAPWLLALTLGVMIIAISGPSWQAKPDSMRENETKIAAVMKISESMESDDILPSRLKRAVFRLKDLMQVQSDARSMLIAYNGSAHLVMPLSKDAEIIYTFAASLEASMMPVEGDALHSALLLAREELDEPSGSMVVFCDSVSPDQIRKLEEDERLRERGIVFYAVGSPELLDLRSIEKAADAVGGSVVVHTPDERSLIDLTDQIAQQYDAAQKADLSGREDGGHALLPLIFIILLLWSRPGMAAQVWRVS